jgi:uncharacterized protein YsxB (DUF464 family)
LIEVLLRIDNGCFSGLKVTGHAPNNSLFGRSGQNILCAGVSTLTQTLYKYFLHQENIASAQISKGYLEFTVKDSKVATTGFEVILTGLEDFAIQYPEAVKIVKD